MQLAKPLPSIFIWQLIISPHMGDLVAKLAARGASVTYVAEQEMSAERRLQGWSPPNVGLANKIIISSVHQALDILAQAPVDAIHICQGIRSNGYIKEVQRRIISSGRTLWVIMETVDDSGFSGVVKRFVYSCLIRGKFRNTLCILANGYNTKRWLIQRGASSDRIFDFAYFLPPVPQPPAASDTSREDYRFGFAGRLIELKRVELLIRSIAAQNNPKISLDVIGDGPLLQYLRELGAKLMPRRINWIGQLPIDQVPDRLRNIDCLVLPSRHDGWGAVISEALMVGTPVICSSACGASGVVRASSFGGVFDSVSTKSLNDLIHLAVERGPITLSERLSLASWARCVDAESGANYLIKIAGHLLNSDPRPTVPWLDKP